MQQVYRLASAKHYTKRIVIQLYVLSWLILHRNSKNNNYDGGGGDANEVKALNTRDGQEEP